MMKEHRILITTFTTWLPHQDSNASDDLLCQLEAESTLPRSTRVLHQLPVCTTTAYDRVRCEIEQYEPHYVICCGMAEQRQQLSIEARARGATGQLWTPISLIHLFSMRKQLKRTEISFDAGQFVCNGIYYALLENFWETIEACSKQQQASQPSPERTGETATLQNTQFRSPITSQQKLNPLPLFVHIPCLTPENQADLRHDFQQILAQLPSHS